MPSSSFTANDGISIPVSAGDIAGAASASFGGTGPSLASVSKQHRSSGSHHSVAYTHMPQNSASQAVTGRGNAAMKESTTSLSLSAGHNSSQGQPTVRDQKQQQYQEPSFFPVASVDTTSIYISSMVTRLVKRLPLHSGTTLLHLEEDPLVRQSVASLVALSQSQLPTILKELTGALESLNKAATHLAEEQVSVTILQARLQSRLLVLRIMSACMMFHWRCCEETSPPPFPPAGCPRGDAADPPLPLAAIDPTPLDDFLAKNILSVLTVTVRQTVAREDRQMNLWAGLASSSSSSSSKPVKADAAHPSRSGQHSGSIREWEQSAAQSGAKSGYWWDDSKEDDSDGVPIHALSLINGFSLFVLAAGSTPAVSPFEVPSPRSPGLGGPERPQRFKPLDIIGASDRPEKGPTESIRSLTKAVYRYASHVISYLSSSNWNVVQARIRNRLLYLSKTAEEAPDSSELRLIECANLDTARLSAILTEINSSFANLRRTVQFNAALVLRRTVWSFIQYHPADFATVYATKRRFDGSPEVLFDYCFALAETHRKKQALWPMMTALFILCPDVVNRNPLGDGNGTAARKGSNFNSKKLVWFEGLKKALKSNKLGDIATLCCVDICKAASYTPPSTDTGLRLLVPELENELRDKLFDPQRPMINQQTKQIEISLLVEGFTSFFRLDPRKTFASLVPICVSETSPIAFKIGFVQAIVRMANEGSPIFWNPRIESIFPVISAWTRRTFKTILHKILTEGEANAGAGGGLRTQDKQRLLRGVAGASGNKVAGKDANRAIDDVDERLQLLKAILHLWRSDLQAASWDLSLNHPTQISSLGNFATDGDLPDHDKLLAAAMQIDSVLSWVYSVGRATYAPGCWELHEPAMGVLSRVVPAPLTGDHANAGNSRVDTHHQAFTLHARRALVSVGAQKRRKYTGLVLLAPDVRSQQHWLAIVKRSIELELQSARAWARMTPEERHLTPRPSFKEYFLERVTFVQTLFVSLCSADNDVTILALRIVPSVLHLLEEAQKRGDWAMAFEIDWNLLLSALSEPSLLTTGRVARQRRIRSMFRGLSSISLPILVTWETIFQRWQAQTKIVAKMQAQATSDASESSNANQWLHYAGALCALSGCCLSETPASGTLELPVELSDTAFPLPSDPTRSVEIFVQQMVELLVHESTWVREKVKDILGLDLDIRANGILLRQIHTVLGDFFDSSTGLPTPTPTYIMFVENSITVAAAVLNRQEEATKWTGNVDIGSLMVLYIEFINALGTKEQALRIKTAVCQLCVTFMSKKTFFAFPNELRIRNRLFQVLSTWTSDGPIEESNIGKLERLQRDLDIACLHIISVLLDGLPLLLADDALMLDDRVEWAKSRQFALYLDYFTKVLHRTRHTDSPVPAGAELVARTHAVHYLTQTKGREQVTKESAPLREYAILSLTHLLASNIDSGLQHSLVLGYSEDLELRSCFIQIMTNVLNQGAAFEDLERYKRSQKQSRLVELVGDSDLALAMAICEGTRFLDPESGMDKILLSIFDSRGGILRFLKAAVEVEIGKTNAEEMVFRSNSNRTHLLSLFARTHGYEYLRTILTPLITEMANKPPGYSFEIEPDKLQPGESAAVNQAHLEEAAQLFIDTICESAPQVPAVMREISRHIRITMDAKFPNSRYQGVGGFMFLRFLGPAIVAPENIDLSLAGANTKELRRGLLLVSKILQTLASNNKFHTQKSPFMVALNDFLTRNLWKVVGFLDGISDACTDPDRLLAADQPLGYGIHPAGYGLDEGEQRVLHKYLFDNADRIGAHLLSRGDSPEAGNEGVRESEGGFEGTKGIKFSGVTSAPPSHRSTGRQVHEQLCQVLADMGPPASTDAAVELALTAAAGIERSGGSAGKGGGGGGSGRGTPANQSQLLQDFLRRAGPRNAKEDEYKKIFFAGPPSRAGRTVFYLNPTRVDADSMDLESLIAYMIKTLESFKGTEFDAVIDATGLKASNLLPLPWALYSGGLVTKETASKCRHMMFFNWNTTLAVYVDLSKRVPEANWPPAWRAFCSSSPQISHFTALSEFDPWIERRNLCLSHETLAITSGISDVRFNSVTMVWYYRSMTPVTFRIGADHLQITSLKAFDIFGNPGYSNDIFHLADIDDVRSVSTRGDDSTFFLTCRGGEISFIFNSRERLHIVQALREARARTSRIKSPKATERTLLPSDVPGRLLNLAMLNMTSDHPALRLSAYNLLCALSTSFNFGASAARKRLVASSCLALPTNTLTFVTELSRELAAAAPGVTLEFFTSFLEGYEGATLVQKTKSLCYMTPWLANLVMFTHTSREQQPEYVKRIKEIFANLLSMTIREPVMFACMQGAVWSHLGKLDDLIPIFLDVFTEAAIDSGIYSERFDAVIDTMVSFSSINLRGKLLARLRRTIVKTAHTPDLKNLHENPLWKEIVTLARMNMAISFTSGRVEALLYLPDILHVVLLLAGVGADATRYTVRGTAINFVHSLCTEDPREGGCNDMNSNKRGKETNGSANATGAEGIPNKAALERLLIRLSSDECSELFGLPDGHDPNCLNISASRTIRPSPDNDKILKLANIIYEIEELAAPSIDAVNSWRARLASLTTSKAFQYNPIIQSRAFLLLGCMAHGEIDDDLLYQILVSLRGAIHEWANKGTSSTVISIVTCLSKVVRILPEHSRYLTEMFWLGISVIQYGTVALFAAGVELVCATVETIQERQVAESMGSDLITLLLDARNVVDDAACQLEDETGVNFDVSFSFSLAALVLKGLRHPSTKERTTRLLRCILEASSTTADGTSRSASGRVSADQLGFFLALLPFATRPETFGELLALAGVPQDVCDEAAESRKRAVGDEGGLLKYFDITDNRSALLSLTLVAALLRTANDDTERLLFYGFLADAGQEHPAILSILYEHLSPGMQVVLADAQSAAMLEAVQLIAQTAIFEPIFSAQVAETARRGGPGAFLEEAGFPTLLDAATFDADANDKERRLVLATLGTALLGGLIEGSGNF